MWAVAEETPGCRNSGLVLAAESRFLGPQGGMAQPRACSLDSSLSAGLGPGGYACPGRLCKEEPVTLLMSVDGLVLPKALPHPLCAQTLRAPKPGGKNKTVHVR